MVEIVKIGICDNEVNEATYLGKMVQECFESKKIEHEIICSINSADFLKHAKDYQIVFLDVEMEVNDIDGLEIGRELRKINKDAYVVYVTNYLQFMAAAQGAHYFYYLTKPLNFEKMIEIVDEILVYLFNEKAIISFMTADGVIDFEVKAINYFELRKKIVTVSTINNRKYDLLISYEELLKIIEKYDFFHSHRAYLINLENIKLVKYDFVIMMNGEKIPISELRTKELKDKFTDFLCSKI